MDLAKKAKRTTDAELEVESKKLELTKKDAEIVLLKSTFEADLGRKDSEITIERNMRIAAEKDIVKLTEPEGVLESPVFWGVTSAGVAAVATVFLTLWVKGDL